MVINPQLHPLNVWNEGAAFADEVEDRVMLEPSLPWVEQGGRATTTATTAMTTYSSGSELEQPTYTSTVCNRT